MPDKAVFCILQTRKSPARIFMKYYFIYYKWYRKFWPNSGNPYCENEKGYEQRLIDIHPLQFQIDENNKFSSYENNFGKGMQDIEILNWKEISQEEYEKYKDEIG
jgi:hypothetical protein